MDSCPLLANPRQSDKLGLRQQHIPGSSPRHPLPLLTNKLLNKFCLTAHCCSAPSSFNSPTWVPSLLLFSLPNSSPLCYAEGLSPSPPLLCLDWLFFSLPSYHRITKMGNDFQDHLFSHTPPFLLSHPPALAGSSQKAGILPHQGYLHFCHSLDTMQEQPQSSSHSNESSSDSQTLGSCLGPQALLNHGAKTLHLPHPPS